MAKTYTAATVIKHGQPDGTKVIFEVGDVVKGLSKEDMKALWDAGALEASDEVPVPEPKEDVTETTETPEDTKTETAKAVATPTVTPVKSATTSTTSTGTAAPAAK